MNDPRGSTWRRWDLHIHTPHSHLSNGFGGDFDGYATQLFRKAIDKKIQVIGITDYFGIWGYKELKDIQTNRLEEFFDAEDAELAANILLLPNIEFRLDVLVDGNRVNFHIIFSDEVDCDAIEENFLGELKVLYEGNPQGLDEARKLSLRTLEQLGRDLKDEHGFDGTDVFVGMSNAFVSYKEISEVLSRQPSLFKDRYLLGVVADEDLSQLAWDGQGHLTRKILVQKSDFLFASNPKTIQWALGELENESPASFSKEFKSLKPCIHGSDAHNYEELFCPDLERFCWIKADPTFEGLKQILYEPRHRVFIGDNPPPTPVHRIERVSLEFPPNVELIDNESSKNEVFCFSGTHQLSFSPNFTCIIGGRGTGKSTLLNVMHERMSSGNNIFFSQRKLLEKGKHLLPVEYVHVDDDEQKYVEFLSQNEIEAFALNQGRFSKAIFDRVERLDSKHTLDAVKEELDSYHKDIIRQIVRLKAIRHSTNKLEEFEREKKGNEKLTESFAAPGYVENREELNSAVRAIQTVGLSKESLEERIGQLQHIVNESHPMDEPDNEYESVYRKLMQGVSQLISDSSESTQFEAVEAELSARRERAALLRGKIESFLNERGLSAENISDVAKATERIAKLASDIETEEMKLRGLLEEANHFQPNEVACSNFQQVIEGLLRPIAEKLGRVNSQQVRSIGIEYFFDSERAKMDLCEKMYEEVPIDPDGRRYNKEAFLDVLFSTPPCEVSDRDSFLRAMQGKSRATKTTEGLCVYFSDEANFETYKLYIRHFFSNANEYKAIRVTYDGKPLSHTSFGQRCTAAIVVLLLIGNTPIMIDEPEAHLDSALISQYLIDLIKSKKTERQVIFATHNANFVVNGDAELTHILSMDVAGITHIDSTTIENLTHREKLLDLEGGVEAFQIRGKKYSALPSKGLG